VVLVKHGMETGMEWNGMECNHMERHLHCLFKSRSFKMDTRETAVQCTWNGNCLL